MKVKHLHYQARRAALEVDFMNTGEEILLYINALYKAMLWGKNKKQESTIDKL